MSEAVFILFALLALIETEKFLNLSRRSSLIGAAACPTHYVGITLDCSVTVLT